MPGRKAYPIGKVTLSVTFGSHSNFRTEKIQFELVNFNNPYHCVLGRHAFSKFMAVPHYTYNPMKIHGPYGIITVRGDPDLTIECETTDSVMADVVIAEEMDDSKELAQYVTDPNDNTILKKPNSNSSALPAFESSKFTRRVDLIEGDSSK